MMISFNSYVFTAAGSTQFSRSSRFEPDARIARPQRELVTWKLKEMFLEPSFADNQARFADLRAALATGEGMLTLTDESERVLFTDRVRVAANDLPEQWGEYTTEVNVELAALPKPVIQSASDGSFTPSGSDTPVALPNVTGWKESVHTERYAEEVVANRRVTMVHISANGRFTADPTTNDAARRAAVLAVKNAIETCNDTPSGTLAYAGMSSVVMIDSADVETGDGTSYCEWSITASYRRFPDGDYSEMEFDVATNDNIEQAERLTVVTGKIRANSQDAATASAATLMATFAETQRIQMVNDTSAKQLQGADGMAFIELSFNFQWRETLSPVSWTLTMSTKADAKSNNQILTLAGTCRSGDSGAALSRAQTLGVVSGQGVLMASTIEYHSRGLDSSEQDFEVTFSYEYLSRAGRVYAEVSNDSTDESFGDMGQVISGFVVANTQNAAVALANGFKLGSGSLLRSSRQNCTTSNAGSGTTDAATFDADNVSLQFIKCDFSYTYYAAHVQGSAKYGISQINDQKTRIQTTTYSGTAWAADAGTANSLIDSIIGTPSGQLIKSDRREDIEQRDEVTGFLAVTFTDTYEGPFTTVGTGVLEGEWSIESTLSVEQAIVTEIPYGTPVVQEDTGFNKATITVAGFASGVSEAAVKAWGRATRAIVQGVVNGEQCYEKPPREKTGFTFYFNAVSNPLTDTVRIFRFDFTYSGEVAYLPTGP